MKKLLFLATAALVVVSATAHAQAVGKRDLTAGEIFADAIRKLPPEPKQVAQCDNNGVLIALQRSTHAYTIIEANNLRSEDPTYFRWCKARVVGPWGFLEVVFTVDWMSEAENRFLVRVEAQHRY